MEKHRANLYQEIVQKLELYHKQIALYEYEQYECNRYTYGNLLKKIISFHHRLLDLGLAPGSRVGIISENCHEWVVAYFAILSMDCIAVPLDIKILPENWVQFLKHCEASAVVISTKIKD
ncbi:MAG: acyl--CoA ligase, partial [Deltaproteobacteria bacterium]|nr:acyl--CoA ligase [Deltaproteobacteria bacterium]